MSGQSAFDQKNILKSGGENRGLLEELNLPPKVISFIRQNSRLLQITGVCLVLAIVGWNYYGNYTQKRNDAAAALLTSALNQAVPEQKLAMLNELVNEYSGTGAAHWGRLEMGHNAYDQGNYTEAAKRYQEVLDDVSSANPLVPLTRFSLAQAYANSDQPDKALQIYEQLVSEKGFATEAQLEAARIYAKQGKADKAREIYSQLLAQEELPPGIKDILESKLAEL
jgi:predicted negative regulator of RcsB-dependent stress response